MRLRDEVAVKLIVIVDKLGDEPTAGDRGSSIMHAHN